MTSIGRSLAPALSRAWWLLLLRGVIAMVFALLTWAQPGITLAVLVLVFGAYVLADGVLGVWMAISRRKTNPRWWVLLLWGLVSVAAGVMTFAAPGVTSLVLLIYIALWAIFTGIPQIVTALQLRKEITNEWLLVLGGLLSVIFGGLMLWSPGAGALAVTWLIATYAFIFGMLMVLLAFRVRKLVR